MGQAEEEFAVSRASPSILSNNKNVVQAAFLCFQDLARSREMAYSEGHGYQQHETWARSPRAGQDGPVGSEAMLMADGFYKQLLEDTIEALERPGRPHRAAVVGEWRIAQRLMVDLKPAGLADALIGTFGTNHTRGSTDLALRSFALEALTDQRLDTLIVASDRDKESYLQSVAPFIRGAPRVVLAGYAHFEFRDQGYLKLSAALSEPSLANGYPNSRIHLYQCLVNATRLRLEGIVVEFGMFRGGTTMFLSQTIESLGQHWPILGFDTFAGFPARRSYLDMYEHPDLRQVQLRDVEDYLAERMVQIIPGDIVETSHEIDGRPIVLAFVDTDNFTPASAAIKEIRDNVVPGGAIVFDHLTGVDRFRYTLGERLAAWQLFDDPRFFNLHGTGVFLRQGLPCGEGRTL
jgi:O-methyltransferase